MNISMIVPIKKPPKDLYVFGSSKNNVIIPLKRNVNPNTIKYFFHDANFDASLLALEM